MAELPENQPGSGMALAAPGRGTPGLLELLELSLAVGLVGFGGGLTVLASIRRTVVEQRGWLSEEQFNGAATVAQMLPGGAAANLLAYIGLRFAGPLGAAVAYLGFIAPGALAVLGLAWAYVRYGATPHVDAALSGFNAAVVGIVAALTVKMLKGSVGKLWQMGVAVMALLLGQVGGAGAGEIALMGIATGLFVDFGLLRARSFRLPEWRSRRQATRIALPEEGHPMPPPGPEGGGTGEPLRSVVLATALAFSASWGWARDLLEIAVVFFRTGLGAYGGGFAIIPQLKATVQSHGWLTQSQFAGAVAVGKLTPGPVLLMATFIGYVHRGLVGAVLATLAIFAAPFLLTVVLSSWLERAQSQVWVRAALAGLTPAIVGLMAGAAITLGSSIDGVAGISIAVAVALTLVRFEMMNPVLMLALGGGARIALRLVMGI